MKSLLTIFFTVLWMGNDQDIVSYRSECVNMTEEGIITILMWDKEEGKRYKIEQAEKDAVAFLMYEGFAGGACQYIGPLLKTYEQKYAFEDSDRFFYKSSGDYDKYVVSSALSEKQPKKVKDDKWKVYEITLNRKSLDQFLVDKGFREKLDIY